MNVNYFVQSSKLPAEAFASRVPAKSERSQKKEGNAACFLDRVISEQQLDAW